MKVALTLLVALTSVGRAQPTGTLASRTGACDYGEGISQTQSQRVQSSFVAARVVPDVVPDIKPTVDLEASFGNKKVDLGNTFSTLETLKKPSITFSAEPGYDPIAANYTLIIIDPDAPGPTSSGNTNLASPFLHMLTYDNHPTCVNDAKSAKTISMYLPFTPLSGAAHRYTFLVYRQKPGEFQPELQDGEISRNNFDLDTFVRQSGLTLVGGNYLLEGWDNLVNGSAPAS